MAKTRLPAALAPWADARSKYGLSHAHIQMARELGMNPKKLGKNANTRQQPWKAPLPVFIEDLYERRFGVRCPKTVTSLEQLAKDQDAKRLAKRRAKEARREAQADALGFAMTAAVDARGVVRDVRPGNMEQRLSDALLEIVKPLVAYPPRESERGSLEAALRLGALVWNATLAAEPAERASALDDLAQRLAQTGGGPLEEVIGVVRDTAARKLALFPDDRRCVVDVGVEVRGKNMLITASSAQIGRAAPSELLGGTPQTLLGEAVSRREHDLGAHRLGSRARYA